MSKEREQLEKDYREAVLSKDAAVKQQHYESAAELRNKVIEIEKKIIDYDNNLKKTDTSVIAPAPPENRERLQELHPELFTELEDMTREQLLEEACGEILDLIDMTDRVSVFMAECTQNMSNVMYTPESLKGLIAVRKENDTLEFCSDLLEHYNEDDAGSEIMETLRDNDREFRKRNGMPYTEKENKFPKLMLSNTKDSNFVVLFSSSEVGMVVSSEGRYSVGYYSSNWTMSSFDDVVGTLQLKQVQD
jgi:hypothetical protein